ncbi:chloride channel protein [Oscillibacter sp.]|jgi:H+/Cl- antiporter ClcA|uniref:chloride channel protein n=1 Tax=Oscillibacter sp. TaxID=1945593 RepID=UPI00216F8773|nr:chloride channel protein [Oscillibacter sp.]MCI9648626.1 chloride channel protein [Oscillibacter sp.]
MFDQERFREWVRGTGLYAVVLAKWIFLSVVVGSLCGVVGAVFHLSVHYAAETRGTYPWLLWCLPLVGLAIVGFYKLMGTEGMGTNDIIDAVHKDKRLPIRLVPSIFLGTMLTHLCGGSAGREGAALQIGGTIGQRVGRLLRLDDQDLRVATLSGMAACFSALFGTPLTAVIFAVMGISIGTMYHTALLPCLMSALAAFGVSLALGVEPTRFTVTSPEIVVGTFLRVLLLSVLFALVSILFCKFIHGTERWMQRWIPNPWVRVVAGGLAIVALTYLVGTRDYNGAGMEIITAAVERGTAHPAAFLLKLLFTAVTLAAGFKGGEVVPSFFVGATLGCVAAPLLGLPAGFGAALGLVSVFCGVTNSPVASVFLSVELFGSEGIWYFALACGISYMLSGYSGLYSSQTILYSKLKARYINVHANSHPVSPEGEGETADRT